MCIHVHTVGHILAIYKLGEMHTDGRAVKRNCNYAVEVRGVSFLCKFLVLVYVRATVLLCCVYTCAFLSLLCIWKDASIYVYMEKGVRRANQANSGQLFQASWPSSAPCMPSCSATA